MVLLSRVHCKTFRKALSKPTTLFASLRTIQWWRDIIFDIREFSKWFSLPFSIQEGTFTTVPRPVTFMATVQVIFYCSTRNTSTWIIKMWSIGQSQPQPEWYSMHMSSHPDLVSHFPSSWGKNGALNNEYWFLFDDGFTDISNTNLRLLKQLIRDLPSLSRKSRRTSFSFSYIVHLAKKNH